MAFTDIDQVVNLGNQASKIESSLDVEMYNSVIIHSGENDEDGDEYVDHTHSDWAGERNYAVDALVVYNSKLYKCITAHRATQSFDETKWERQPGYVLEIKYPWLRANSNMAQNILDSIKGKSYTPFSISDALIDPAFELGDIVQSGDLYSPILSMSEKYHSLYTSDIEAPGENETEHEYQYENHSDSLVERELKGIRTSIRVQNGLIEARIESDLVSAPYYKGSTEPEEKTDLMYWCDTSTDPASWKRYHEGVGWQSVSEEEGLQKTSFTRMAVTLDGVIFQNDAGTTVIDGSHITTGRISAGLIVFNSDADKWDWDDFNNAFHTKFTATDDRSQEAIEKAEEALENQYSDQDVRNYLHTAAEITTTVGSGSFLASPHIVGGEIYASKIFAGDGTNLVDPWLPENEYVRGEHVYYDNGTHKYWTAANDHTSGETFDVGHWTEYYPTQGAYIELSGDGMDLYDPANVDASIPNLHIGYAGNESTQAPLYTPYILFGVGNTSGRNKGLVKKFTTGMWIGNDDALASPSDPRGIGIFCDFSNEVVKTLSPLVIPEVMYGDQEPTFAAEEGQLYFMLTDE